MWRSLFHGYTPAPGEERCERNVDRYVFMEEEESVEYLVIGYRAIQLYIEQVNKSWGRWEMDNIKLMRSWMRCALVICCFGSSSYRPLNWEILGHISLPFHSVPFWLESVVPLIIRDCTNIFVFKVSCKSQGGEWIKWEQRDSINFQRRTLFSLG